MVIGFLKAVDQELQTYKKKQIITISYCCIQLYSHSLCVNMDLTSIVIVVLFLVTLTSANSRRRPTENERVELWHKNVVHWPPRWHEGEESPQYQAKQAAREEEIMMIPGSNERWENWMQFVAGRIVHKFTPMGFKVIQTPPQIHEKLYKKVMDAVNNQWDDLPEEQDVNAIYGETNPLFVDMEGLDWEVLEDLQPLHEEWAGGMKLFPTSAYGVRLYQNGSSLVMHHDKVHTHVISSIVHIAHEYYNESQPWPIQIEDHDGNLHSVNLKSGQMLFYESAKCLHGRMQAFHGKYYGSIFLHYAPVDKKTWGYDVEQVIAAVPPHWSEGVVEDEGSRWAGQALTVDSMAAAGAPPRVVKGKFVHARTSPHSYVEPPAHDEL